MTRSLGTDKALEVDTGSIELTEGMAFLLCSDGLSNMVHDVNIMQIINKKLTPDQKVDALVDLANKNGGKDNISLIILTETEQ